MMFQTILFHKDLSRVVKYYQDGADDGHATNPDASAWQGIGAQALGLEGPVDPARFRELLAGEVTPGEIPTRIHTRADRRPHIGMDLTFHAPKSVSLQALVGKDVRVLEAHDRAVAAAVRAAEERALAARRVKGEQTVERTRNLIVARFRHETSRGGDPHLHTHAVALALTRRSDGAWRSLQTREISMSTRYIGSVYLAELAAELQAIGYALRPGRDGTFELAHIDRAQILAFSRRQKQIVEHLAASGLTLETATQRQTLISTYATRPKYRPRDRGELDAEWQARARAAGIDFARKSASLSDARGRARFDRTAELVKAQAFVEGARRSVRFALAHLTERQAIVEEGKLLEVALKHVVGHARLADVRREIERLSQTGYLVPETPLFRLADGPPPGRTKSAWVAEAVLQGRSKGEARAQVDAEIRSGRLVPAERRFTTQTALDREKRILRIERAGRESVRPIAPAKRIQRRLAFSDLNDGQRTAVELITTTTARVVGVQGYAGTGKTHMLDQARSLVEEHGYRVVTLAPYAAHVRVLRQHGVEARTVASFAAAKEKVLDDKTVLVIDEAGTVPTRHMVHALKLAEEAGARVVLLGDTAQTKAIEAGRPFDQLQRAGMETAVMAEIERQTDPTLREAVALAARGEAASSLELLSHVRQVSDDHERRRAVARDYARLPEDERAATIILSGTNEARREINKRVREDLGLAGKGYEFATLSRRDTTKAERTYSQNYSPGEIIQPERDYKTAGLSRGALYEVLESGPGNRLTVRTENGKVLEFSPAKRHQLSVYEPERSELAAGDRVRITRNDAALELANGDRFTVKAVSPALVTLTDGKRTIALPADRPLHLDHAYATTVHASQGTTAERVLFDATTRSRTMSQETYYVAISRARREARIYTDDLERLPSAVAREQEKHAAMDLERG